MSEEKEWEEKKAKVNCPNCGVPIGEGACPRCANYRFAVKENGGIMVMM